MNTNEIKARLVHAVTAYDRKQSTKRGYNPYALGQYLERVEMIMGDIANGAEPRKAILAGFNDRLLDHCLKAVGETGFTANEVSGQWAYTPVAG
jgi:hypothetical protein